LAIPEFFAEDILRAISSARLDVTQPHVPPMSNNRDIITRILIRKSCHQNPYHSRFFVMVAETVEFLMQLDPDQSEQQRRRYTRALCAADNDTGGDQSPFPTKQSSLSNIYRYLLFTTSPSQPVNAEVEKQCRISETPVQVNAMVRLSLFSSFAHLIIFSITVITLLY